LVGILSESKRGSVGIQAGTITAENVVNGVQVIHRWGQAPPTEKAITSLQRSYLSHLFETVGHVSLAGVDRKAKGDYAPPGRAETRIDLHAVYTALLTLTSEECERLRDKDCLPEQMRGERPRLLQTSRNLLRSFLDGRSMGRQSHSSLIRHGLYGLAPSDSHYTGPVAASVT
jgi:hypothetical protein